MKNVSEIKDCYGCGVCAVVCSRRIVEIRLNRDGFYEPSVTDAAACNECGFCIDCCAYSHVEAASAEKNVVTSYAVWSNDEAVRWKCSSGGASYEIGRLLLAQGYRVCAVRYNAELQRAEHFIAATPEEYLSSVGSKYLQSYTADAFRAIDRKKRYLITGTPCQIDSFRRYLKKFRAEDRFVLLDFFCHGVPSRHVWTKYLEKVEARTGRTADASWRNKVLPGFIRKNGVSDTGKIAGKWTDSWRICTQGEKTYYVAGATCDDDFYTLFLSNICLGKACYDHCKYKYVASAADIRIGDLWGKTYRESKAGVSAVLALTEKGRRLVDSLDRCTVRRHSLAEVTEGQINRRLRKPWLRQRAIACLRRPDAGLETAVRLAKIQRSLKVWNYRLGHPGFIVRKIWTKIVSVMCSRVRS